MRESVVVGMLVAFGWWLVCDEGGAKFIRFGINLVVSRRGKEGFSKGRSSILSCPPEMEERDRLS